MLLQEHKTRQDFIEACERMDHDRFMSIMHSVCSDTITEDHLNNFESLWSILNESQVQGYPNGAEFLWAVQEGLDDPDDETAEMFLSYFGIE